MEPVIIPNPERDAAELLGAVLDYLASRGVASGEHGYDARALSTALEARGWGWQGDPPSEDGRFAFRIRVAKRGVHMVVRATGTVGTRFAVEIPTNSPSAGSEIDPATIAFALAVEQAIRANDDQASHASVRGLVTISVAGDPDTEFDQPPPESDLTESTQFVRVIPIAQTVAQRGVAISLLSLESYQFDSVIHVSARLAPDHPVRLAKDEASRQIEDMQARGAGDTGFHDRAWRMSEPFTEFSLEVRDDLGNRYAAQMTGGGASGYQWDAQHILRPALDPRAQQLTIDVAFGWHRFSHDFEQPDQPPPAERWFEPGRWPFQVDLTRGVDSTETIIRE